MLSRFSSRLSYAKVIATLALFLALRGSSYAALNLPKASVGPEAAQEEQCDLTQGQARLAARKRLQGFPAREPAWATGTAGPAGTERRRRPVRGDEGDQSPEHFPGNRRGRF